MFPPFGDGARKRHTAGYKEKQSLENLSLVCWPGIRRYRLPEKAVAGILSPLPARRMKWISISSCVGMEYLEKPRDGFVLQIIAITFNRPFRKYVVPWPTASQIVKIRSTAREILPGKRRPSLWLLNVLGFENTKKSEGNKRRVCYEPALCLFRFCAFWSPNDHRK